MTSAMPSAMRVVMPLVMLVVMPLLVMREIRLSQSCVVLLMRVSVFIEMLGMLHVLG